MLFRSNRNHALISLLGILVSGILSGCIGSKDGAEANAPVSTPVAIADVAQPFTTSAQSTTLSLDPSSFYAALEASSTGIVTAADRCRPELLTQLASFAKSFLAIDRSAAFLVTVDIKADGKTIYDDLPLLIIQGGSSNEQGATCEVTGLAVSANSSRITPYFRVDPGLEIQLLLDLKVVDAAHVGATQAILDHAQQIMGLAGGQAVVVGKLGSDLTSGLAYSLDSAIAASLKGASKDEISASIRRTAPIGTTPNDGVRFDLAQYLTNGSLASGVSADATIILDLRYRRSIIGEDGTDDRIHWPASADTLLSFRRAIDGPSGTSFGTALDQGSLPAFNPTFLRALPEGQEGRRLMQEGCRALKSHLEDDIELTQTDALVVRRAALSSKTGYFSRPDLWSDECLSGAYLAQASSGPAIAGEAEVLQSLNPAFGSPGVPANASWERQIEDRIRDLRLISIADISSSNANSPIRLSIEELNIFPNSFFADKTPNIPWLTSQNSEVGPLLRRIAYGGLCGRVLSVHSNLSTLRDLALFGRLQGIQTGDFAGWRDKGGRPIIPLVTTWSMDEPPQLIEMRATSVDTIQQDYSRTVATWPRDGQVPSCSGIHQ